MYAGEIRRRQSATEARLKRELPGWWAHSIGTYDRRTLYSAGPEGFGTAIITDQSSPDSLIEAVRAFEAHLDHHLDDARHRLADAKNRANAGAAGGYARDQANVLAGRVEALEKLWALREATVAKARVEAVSAMRDVLEHVPDPVPDAGDDG